MPYDAAFFSLDPVPHLHSALPPLHADPLPLILAVMVFPGVWGSRAKGDAARMIAAAGAALAVILSGSAGGNAGLVAALGVGGLGMLERASCPLVWATPALLGEALFPRSPLAALALLPVLYWPVYWPVPGREARFPALAPLLAASLLCQAKAEYALVVTIGAGVTAAGFGWRNPAARGLARPVLLAAAVFATGAEGLVSAERGGLTALLLDLLLIVVPGSARLRAPLPPLPGFVVLWLGIHAALGLAAGATGWSIVSVLLALLIGAVSLTRIPASRPVTAREIGALIAGTLLLPPLCGAAAAWVLPGEGGIRRAFWPALSSALSSVGGGDGAHLRIAALLFLLGGVWALLVRPWRGPVAFPGLEAPPVALPAVALPRLILPWSARRMIARLRTAARALRAAAVFPSGLKGSAVGLWLALLAVILLIVGARS